MFLRNFQNYGNKFSLKSYFKMNFQKNCTHFYNFCGPFQDFPHICKLIEKSNHSWCNTYSVDAFTSSHGTTTTGGPKIMKEVGGDKGGWGYDKYKWKRCRWWSRVGGSETGDVGSYLPWSSAPVAQPWTRSATPCCSRELRRLQDFPARNGRGIGGEGRHGRGKLIGSKEDMYCSSLSTYTPSWKVKFWHIFWQHTWLIVLCTCQLL